MRLHYQYKTSHHRYLKQLGNQYVLHSSQLQHKIHNQVQQRQQIRASFVIHHQSHHRQFPIRSVRHKQQDRKQYDLFLNLQHQQQIKYQQDSQRIMYHHINTIILNLHYENIQLQKCSRKQLNNRRSILRYQYTRNLQKQLDKSPFSSYHQF